MNKPKFNLDAHSILLLCNGEQVDTDAGKLQLTIVEQAEQAKPTIDLHKDSWGVKNDGSQRFKDTVIKWMSEQNDVSLLGGANAYYGKDYTGVFHYSPSKHRFIHILTIDEFCALAYPKEGVTDEPAVKSLKYEDCFERVKPTFWMEGGGCGLPTERQAKQLAAIIKLMTIIHDANEGWIPTNKDVIYVTLWDRETNELAICEWDNLTGSLIYFKDVDTALRAYEQNKEIFHDYFGINE